MIKKESIIPLKSLLFSFHAANAIIVTFLPLYLQYKGLNGNEIGWVLAIGPLASIAAQPFWGFMSDKYHTVKRILLICIMGLLLTITIFFQMNYLVYILMMAAVFFFFASPIGALSDSLAQRKSVQLGVNFGSIRTWGSIGFAFSALLVGELLDIVGIQYLMWPYLLFGLAAIFSCLRLTDVEVEPGAAVKLGDVKKLLKNIPLLIFLFLMMFLTVTHRASDSFLGLYIKQLGGSEGIIGIAWFIGVASEALVFAFAGYWYRKFHPLIFVITAGLLYSSRWFIYASATDPLIIISFQFLHGLTFGTFYLSAFQYVSRLIPKTLQSTGHLFFVTVFFGISGIIGSLLGGTLIDSFGGARLYFILGFSSLIGSILFIIYHLLPYGKEISSSRK